MDPMMQRCRLFPSSRVSTDIIYGVISWRMIKSVRGSSNPRQGLWYLDGKIRRPHEVTARGSTQGGREPSATHLNRLFLWLFTDSIN